MAFGFAGDLALAGDLGLAGDLVFDPFPPLIALVCLDGFEADEVGAGVEAAGAGAGVVATGAGAGVVAALVALVLGVLAGLVALEADLDD